jgi:hypothetical protein
MKRILPLLMWALCACALGFVGGCGGGSAPIVVAFPAGTAPMLDAGQSQTFTIMLTHDTKNLGVTWSLASAGTLSNVTTTSVTYNAPAGPLTASVTDHLTATSVADKTKSVTVAIVITASPAISTTMLAGGVVGTAYNATVAATGGAGTLTFIVSTGNLPGGLTLSSAGAITGTPNTVGTFPFTVKVTDSNTGGGGPQSATKALSITVNQTAAITSANNATFVVGTAGTFTVTATGTPTPSLAETGTLPTGVTFNAATGVLSGTPAAGTAAAYPIMFTAHNGIGADAVQNFTLTVGQPPAITSANTTTFTVGTAGTFTVTATGFPAPTFSETGALPTGVTLNTTTGVLSGTPAAGTGKTYAIMFTANNGVGTNATQSFTLTVDQAAAVTSANSTTFTVGAAGTFTVTATGFPAPTLSETGTLPTGVIFTPATGVLSGTPAPGTAAAYPIMFTAHNGIGADAVQNFTLTVGQPPAITSANSTTFTVGTGGTFTVTATGFPAPTFSETGALPTGVTFNTTTGVLSGTPTAGTGKTYSIMFTASNGVGSNATQNFTLTVDQAPAITSASSTTFSVGAAGTFTVTTTGFPTPTLSETGTLPAGVSFGLIGPGTGMLAGTPAAGTNGTYPITFTASNGVGSPAGQSFTLTVNTAPVITSASNTTFSVGTPGTFTVTATGTPSPTLSETGTLPTGVTFNPGTGVLSGTPAAGTGGTYPITFTASNGVGSPATQSFTLTVDQAPAIISPNSATFTVGTSSSFTVMTSGFPRPTLSDGGATLPSGVTFVDNGNGTATLSGTPASGSLGTYTITFTATNGVGSPANQTFTLTVNTAPVITSGNSTTFTVGAAGTFTVMATGTPAPTLSETGTLPTGVTFTPATGVLGGTPAAGTGGTYAISFKASSSSGNTTQNFTLTVDQAPAITSATSATFTVGSNGSFTVTTTGFPLDPITETGALPTGVTFVDNGNNTATLSGTPAAGTAASYPITITASNGVLPNATQAFTLTVTSASACGSGSESLLSGGYAFLLKGLDSSGNPALVGGVITLDGAGHVTAGTMDMNLNSGVQTAINVSSGTFSVGSDHRGCMSLTTSSVTNATQTFRFSVGNISGTPAVASTGHMINFDSGGPFTTGILRKQSGGPFSPASVTGSFAFGGSSIQNAAVGGGKFAFAGVITFNGSGGITSGSEDINQNGTLDGSAANTTWPASPISFNPTGSSYSLTSNGRGTLTIAITPTVISHDFIYGVSSTEALFMNSDAQTSTLIGAGEALKQTGAGAFTNSSLSGTYVGYSSALGSTAGTNATDLFLLSLSNGNVTGTDTRNDGSTFGSQSIAAGTTYAVAPSGRTLTTGGGHPPVLYLVNSNEAFFLGSNGRVDSGFFQSQTSTSAPSGIFGFGTIDPEDVNAVNASVNSGVATFASPNISAINDNNSNGFQAVGTTNNATFSVDSTGLVHIPSTCTVSATSTTCQLIIYIISPTKAVVMDTSGATNSAIQVADK